MQLAYARHRHARRCGAGAYAHFERFSDACPQVRQLLGTIETWNVWVLCDRKPVEDWTDRRVNLLGEAPLSFQKYQQVRCMRSGNCVIKCFKAARNARDLQV